jgi:hypothetical protein
MTDKVFNRFEVEIKKYYYAFRRYKSVSSFILLHYEKSLSVVELSAFLRLSDKILEIDENIYFITFTFTSGAHTFKAAENLLLELDRHFNSRDSYIAMEEINLSNTPKMVINKLMQILEETKKHSYSRIEDESILNANI